MGAQCQPIILVDTREQRPFDFSVRTEIATLQTGDYSIVGFEDQITIERKSLPDLIGCLAKQRKRFEAELLRASALSYAAVIIEAPYSALADGRYMSHFNPKSAIESVSAFEIRYGVPFLFCENRALAARKCESLLLKFHRERSHE